VARPASKLIVPCRPLFAQPSRPERARIKLFFIFSFIVWSTLRAPHLGAALVPSGHSLDFLFFIAEACPQGTNAGLFIDHILVLLTVKNIYCHFAHLLCVCYVFIIEPLCVSDLIATAEFCERVKEKSLP
jgi:hypothetical protein